MPDVVLVHRISGLPRASFRFHLAMDTLASGYALGATPCARDFHPLERAHAGRTSKMPRISYLVRGILNSLVDFKLRLQRESDALADSLLPNLH